MPPSAEGVITSGGSRDGPRGTCGDGDGSGGLGGGGGGEGEGGGGLGDGDDAGKGGCLVDDGAGGGGDGEGAHRSGQWQTSRPSCRRQYVAMLPELSLCTGRFRCGGSPLSRGQVEHCKRIRFARPKSWLIHASARDGRQRRSSIFTLVAGNQGKIPCNKNSATEELGCLSSHFGRSDFAPALVVTSTALVVTSTALVVTSTARCCDAGFLCSLCSRSLALGDRPCTSAAQTPTHEARHHPTRPLGGGTRP